MGNNIVSKTQFILSFWQYETLNNSTQEDLVFGVGEGEGRWIRSGIVSCSWRIVNHKDHHFKYRNQSWDANIRRNQSKHSLCFLNDEGSLVNYVNYWTLIDIFVLNTLSNLTIAHVYLMFVSNYKPYLVPLTYGLLFTERNYIWVHIPLYIKEVKDNWLKYSITLWL